MHTYTRQTKVDINFPVISHERPIALPCIQCNAILQTIARAHTRRTHSRKARLVNKLMAERALRAITRRSFIYVFGIRESMWDHTCLRARIVNFVICTSLHEQRTDDDVTQESDTYCIYIYRCDRSRAGNCSDRTRTPIGISIALPI